MRVVGRSNITRIVLCIKTHIFAFVLIETTINNHTHLAVDRIISPKSKRSTSLIILTMNKCTGLIALCLT